MVAFIDLLMDRPIDKEKHIITPGGYEVVAGGKNYQFDFTRIYGNVDKDNDHIIHFQLEDEDIESFPDIKELKNHLNEITELVECFVYTGEANEPEIKPAKILSFVIIEKEANKLDQLPNSTEYIDCITTIRDNEWETHYKMTDKVICDYKFE